MNNLKWFRPYHYNTSTEEFLFNIEGYSVRTKEAQFWLEIVMRETKEVVLKQPFKSLSSAKQAAQDFLEGEE